jgi:hypothetical protein
VTTIALALLRKFWPYLLGALLVIAAVIWWNRYVHSIEARGDAGGYARATAEGTAKELAQLQVNQKAFAALIAARDIKDAALSASADKHLSDLRTAQNETTRLASGSVGLRVFATCPQSTPRLGTQTTPGTRVDTGTGAELDAAARQAYFALRIGINQVDAKLAACQDELRLRQ